MSLGERLKILRSWKGNTLEEKSKSLQVSLNTVYRWECDSVVPRKNMLKKIADYYCVPFSMLDSDTCSKSLFFESEKKLIELFRKMPVNKKVKIIRHASRLYIEN